MKNTLAVACTLPRVRLAAPRIRPDVSRDALLMVGVLAGIAQVLGVIPVPHDALAYWTADLRHLYPASWLVVNPTNGYVYPPPLAQLMAPLHMLPWAVFVVAWTTALFGALWLMTGRWVWVVVIAGVLAIVFPIPAAFGVGLGYALNGNIQLFIGAAVVLAVKRPALWAFPLLTKAGPGIGLLWHVVRGDWRAVGTAVISTCGVVIISFVIYPDAWAQFVAFLRSNSLDTSPLDLVPIPWPVRLAMAAALIAWGVWRDHAWTIPIAAGWASPALYLDSYWGIWLGAIRLSGWADVPVKTAIRQARDALVARISRSGSSRHR